MISVFSWTSKSNELSVNSITATVYYNYYYSIKPSFKQKIVFFLNIFKHINLRIELLVWVPLDFTGCRYCRWSYKWTEFHFQVQLLDWEKQRRPPEVSYPRKTWSVEASKIEGLNRPVVMSRPCSQGPLKQEREPWERGWSWVRFFNQGSPLAQVAFTHSAV